MAFPVEKLMKQRLSCSDVVQCAYSLGEQEVRTYETLNNLGPSRVEEVAASLEREASVVYRNLQKLLSCGIVTKEKRTIAGGGYFFVYKAAPKAQVKASLNRCVDDWYRQMKAAIERL